MRKTFQQGIVITQTPFRISFFGGGTDFPGYFNQHGGMVIGTAIDKYLYVTLNSLERFYDKRIRLSYSKLECVDNHNDLEHNIVRCILENHPYWAEQTFLDLHTYADFPSSCGLGSSSSCSVGMLNTLYLLDGEYKTSEQIAKEAIHIEREQLLEAGGWQDQIFAAYGGFNCIRFAHNNFIVEPICLALDKRQALEQSCMLFYTGDTHFSAKIQQQVMRVEHSKYLKEVQLIAIKAFHLLKQSISKKDLIYQFGILLDQAWQAKKVLSDAISNEKIDSIYELAIKAGAIGGKLCGAGGGGFLLFIVPEEKRTAVAQALAPYKKFNITFEENGTRAIYSKICHAGIV